MTNPKGAIPISFVTAHDRAVRRTLSAILGSAFACNKSCRVLRHTLAGLQNKNQKCHHSFTQIVPMHATWLQWIATKLKLNFLIRNVCVKRIRFGVFFPSHFIGFSLNTFVLMQNTLWTSSISYSEQDYWIHKTCLQLTERQKNCLRTDTSFTLRQRNLKTAFSLSICKRNNQRSFLVFPLRKARTGKTHGVVVFENFFNPHWNGTD